MRKIVLALGVATTLALTGCASNKGIDESGYSNTPLVNRQGKKLKNADAQKLYVSARDFLLHNQPSQALPLYAAVVARYPFSRYAPQSQLETIAAHYDAGDYDEAVQAADTFIKQHPSSANADYAYYMRGLANYARNNPTLLRADPDKRNVVYLKQAFTDFSLLLKRYPNSIYAKDAQLHMIDIRNRVAASDLRIAAYYFKRHAYVGAVRRADDIVTQYQGSTSVPRALEIMEESYVKLKEPDLAEDTHAILQASYPEYLLNRSQFYEQLAAQPSNANTPQSAPNTAPVPTEPAQTTHAPSAQTPNSQRDNSFSVGGMTFGTHNPHQLPAAQGNSPTTQ